MKRLNNDGPFLMPRRNDGRQTRTTSSQLSWRESSPEVEFEGKA